MRATEKIKGIVLAGTYQWGDSTFETLLPRPLVPVAQAPLISYTLEWPDGSRMELSEGARDSPSLIQVTPSTRAARASC